MRRVPRRIPMTAESADARKGVIVTPIRVRIDAFARRAMPILWMESVFVRKDPKVSTSVFVKMGKRSEPGTTEILLVWMPLRFERKRGRFSITVGDGQSTHSLRKASSDLGECVATVKDYL